MDISVIIPLYNEEESLPELIAWIKKVMLKNDFSYEIILIDDGSNDESWSLIYSFSEKDEAIRGIKFRRNYGKSAALYCGFRAAKGEVVITMDADMQDSPDEIPSLYKMIMDEDYDVVSGWKKKRYDSIIFKNFPSKIFNWAARKTSGIKLNDFNCGLKAYKIAVIKEIKLTGGMHRYIPVLAKNAGFVKITEKIVKHHPRKHGKTKYGADRFVKGFLDLITLWFIHKFGKRPMHFFGLIGTVMLLVGFFFSIYLGIDKLFIKTSGRLITERPEFFIALATMIMGSQFFLAGFLGEIILRNKKIKKQYKIAEKLINE